MTTCCIELETIRAQLADLQAHYEAALEAEQVRHRQLTEAQQRIAERDAEIERFKTAKQLPVAWVFRFDDPDHQYEIEFSQECPSGWVGKAEPLFEGACERNISLSLKLRAAITNAKGGAA